MKHENDVLISIITVCKNSESTIERTIQSVVEQTYPYIEYIVVDGKSTDKTMDIVNKFRDRINRIICEEDSGIYDAMNKGIMAATGDIVAFINSDDWYSEDVIVDVINEYKKCGADVLYGNYTIVEDGRKELMTFEEKEIESLREWQWLPHPATFTRAYLYKEVLFDTRYRIAADYSFFLELLNRGASFHYYDCNISFFSRNGVSGREFPSCMREVAEIAISEAKKYQYWSNEFEEKIKGFYYSSIEWFYREQLMRSNILETWVKRHGFRTKKTIVFCDSEYSRNCIQYLNSNGIKPLYIVDNNKAKWREEKNGYCVKSPRAISEEKDIIVVIATKKKKQAIAIAAQLNDMNLDDSIEWVDFTEAIESGIKFFLKEKTLN